MMPKPHAKITQKLKCFFGYHDWKDTGTRRMYGFVYLFKCTRCPAETEMIPENISFGKIAGQDIMVIRR